jgi:XRE family transcriptional regulator of biofilm formation
MSIGERIRDFRMKRGLSLTELASRAGVAKSYVSSVERGLQLNPSIQFLHKVSTVLGVNVETLINENTDSDEKMDTEWLDLAKEAMNSGISIEQFKEFLEFQKWQKMHK